MEKVVVVFTSKPLGAMIDEGGSGYWSANKKRLEKCSYLIATKSNTLRDRFPGNTHVNQSSAFLIGKISGIVGSSKGDRLVIQFSEYAEINIPNVWPGNRNPVTYTNIDDFQSAHSLNLSALEWKEFPESTIKFKPEIKALSIDEAKAGIAKTLGVHPSCIEIQIKA